MRQVGQCQHAPSSVGCLWHPLLVLPGKLAPQQCTQSSTWISCNKHVAARTLLPGSSGSFGKPCSLPSSWSTLSQSALLNGCKEQPQPTPRSLPPAQHLQTIHNICDSRAWHAPRCRMNMQSRTEQWVLPSCRGAVCRRTLPTAAGPPRHNAEVARAIRPPPSLLA